MRISGTILRFWQSPQGQLLEQAEQFEHDYDNNNHSDYVEDISVHLWLISE